MGDAPDISVVMPVWNGAKYIREAINSILNQTFTNFEFIIIDDGSTDQTIEIVQSYDDPRIRLFNRAHEGIVSALNFGVAQSRAEWIARLDADDLAYPRRLEWQWDKIRKTRAILCYGRQSVLSQMSRPVRNYIPSSRALLKLMLCFYCPIPHTSVLFSKKAFYEAGGYLESERHAEDFGLWGRMVLLGKTARTRQRIVKFRRHEGSITFNCGKEQVEIAMRLRKKHRSVFLDTGLCDEIESVVWVNDFSASQWLRVVRSYNRKTGDTSWELYRWAFFVFAKRALKPFWRLLRK